MCTCVRDTEPTYTTSNDIQYYRDTIAIVTCFHTIVIVYKFHYRPALSWTSDTPQKAALGKANRRPLLANPVTYACNMCLSQQ